MKDYILLLVKYKSEKGSNYFPDENVDQWNVERWVEETGAEFIKCPPGLF
jgi:hypothetical protein